LSSFTVIIPTLICRDTIEAHVQALRRWYAAAAEVFVVDSESDDGTLESLRENLDHPNVYFSNRPRGLYAAWNFGVQQCHSDNVYFATIGDEIGPG